MSTTKIVIGGSHLIAVGSFILWRDPSGHRNRLWEVTAIHLGGEGQESVIAMVPLIDRINPIGEVLVPEPILRNATNIQVLMKVPYGD